MAKKTNRLKYIVPLLIFLLCLGFVSCSTLSEGKTEELVTSVVQSETINNSIETELTSSVDIIDSSEEISIFDLSEIEDVETSEYIEIEKLYTKADVDGDGKTTADDYILLKRAIFGLTDFCYEQICAGDLNCNDKLDPTDYILLKRIYFGTIKLDDMPKDTPIEDETSLTSSIDSEYEISEDISDVTHGEYESEPEESSEAEISEPIDIESSEVIEDSSAEVSIETSAEDNSDVESSEDASSEPLEEISEDISDVTHGEYESSEIESEPVESETSEPIETSTPEESEPVDDDPFAKYHVQINTMSQEEAEALIEECILMYINKYRVEEGKCEMQMLTGKARAFAKGRSVQLTTNFAHDVDAMRELATELEYGRYVPPFPESYYDFEKDEVVYTGEMTEPYYQYVGGEAISEYGYASWGYVDSIAGMMAGGIYKSAAHWDYVGNNANIYAAIGVEDGYACILVLDTDEYD